MDLVNSQLVATQQQLQQLQERYNELSMHHSLLMQELIGVQKTVINHEHVMQNVINFLHTVDKQRRDSRAMGGPFGQAAIPESAQDGSLAGVDDAPASPLMNASRLLQDLNSDVQLNFKNLEHLNEIHSRSLIIGTPPPDAIRNGGGAPTSAGSSASMGYAKLTNELENVVYPVGQTQGIDPMYSEHINNIPYPMPSKDAPQPPFTDARKRSTQVDPGWIRAPQILLVEDDPTCRRIGGKFLYSFNCHIDSAVR
jgi:osomolarity two-component system response regulator SKN7